MGLGSIVLDKDIKLSESVLVLRTLVRLLQRDTTGKDLSCFQKGVNLGTYTSDTKVTKVSVVTFKWDTA